MKSTSMITSILALLTLGLTNISGVYSAEIDTNELLAVGEGGDERPYGTISAIDPLTIETFFEANPVQFEAEGGIDESITIEVYANVPTDEDDCRKGTLLVDVENEFVITTESKNYTEFKGETYNEKYESVTGRDYPVNDNGVIGVAIVEISNFEYVPTEDEKKIWFLGEGAKDGEIRLCIVTAIKVDYDEDGSGSKEYYVEELSTKRILSVDLVANNIGSQVVEITESEATSTKTNAVLNVNVVAFVCNSKNEKVKPARTYTTGTNFRICVGPDQDGIDKGYKIDDYIELKCGGRNLITADSDSLVKADIDVFTRIKTPYDENKNVLAVRSVLTATDADDKQDITCTGKVSLSYTDPSTGPNRGRYLETSTELVPSGAAGAEELLEGLFDMDIKMIIPTNESSAPPLTTAAAIVGFGSVLSTVAVILMM